MLVPCAVARRQRPSPRTPAPVEMPGYPAGHSYVLMRKLPTTIRPAELPERHALEALQRRSSVHDPMYRAQLEAHPDAIELPAEQITAGLVRVAERDGAVVGFAVLLDRRGDACELDGLFVEPERMRTGVGRQLVEDAKRLARERGATRIDVVANPQAIAFYEAVGFSRAGEAQTRFGPAPRMSLSTAGRR